MSDQDRPLVKRVLRGDLDAFTVLVKRYESPIVNYIHWIVVNQQDAMDVDPLEDSTSVTMRMV